MNEILSNPRALIALLCVIALVLGVNALLFSAFRGGSFAQHAAKWGQAFGGGADIRKRRQEQLDELHDRVDQLQSKKRRADEKDS